MTAGPAGGSGVFSLSGRPYKSDRQIHHIGPCRPRADQASGTLEKGITVVIFQGGSRGRRHA